MRGQRIRKWYQVGRTNPDGTCGVDVADYGQDNWRQRETCPSQAMAEAQAAKLNQDEEAFWRSGRET